ncbi:hypothetical protein WJ45_26295 [Burkholderia ubonensis]|nr:hypothetical protein WJ45_26295 [Burkholderia ubonensis]KVQ39599.1 hypothetical protein WK04_19460 [Burkholderia ubonensis]
MVAAAAIGYLALRVLETLATRLGVVLLIHFDHPVTSPVLIGNSWQIQTYTSDHTFSWMLLVILASTIAFWLGRSVFHGNIRAAFNRRWLWIMAGWALIVTLMIAGLRLIQPHHLPTIPLLIVLGLLGQFWRALMRVCGVPARDAFSDPDFDF